MGYSQWGRKSDRHDLVTKQQQPVLNFKMQDRGAQESTISVALQKKKKSNKKTLQAGNKRPGSETCL